MVEQRLGGLRIELRHRLGILVEGDADVVVGEPVVVGHLGGMLEQRVAVDPIADLLERDRAEHREDHDGGGRQGDAGLGPAVGHFFQQPGNHQVHADHRQVRITIGAGLRAHLDDADDGHQRPQEPEPADGQIALPPEPENGRP